jgi:PP-loop superfamily ATP-utilizing enzyme
MKNSKAIQTCTRCILNSQVPNITFDNHGVCNFCLDYDEEKKYLNRDYPALEKKMLSILNVGKSKQYDCMVLYSGGKDSTYMLYKLANHYNLKVLAFTFDNHFIPPETYANIDRVLKKINVDHIVYKPSWNLNKTIFNASFQSSSLKTRSQELAFLIGHACWPCFSQIALHSFKIAAEKNIKNVVVGTTPGQLRQKKFDLKSKFSGVSDAYYNMISPMIELLKTLGKSQTISTLDPGLAIKLKIARMNLVPFFEYNQYNEHQVYETIERELDWRRTKSTDSCSTNCQLNSLGIAIHQLKYNLHPYVIPLARDVREGLMTRDEALKVVSGEVNEKLVNHIAESFDLDLKKIANS